jgi:hypothetical protein
MRSSTHPAHRPQRVGEVSGKPMVFADADTVESCLQRAPDSVGRRCGRRRRCRRRTASDDHLAKGVDGSCTYEVIDAQPTRGRRGSVRAVVAQVSSAAR